MANTYHQIYIQAIFAVKYRNAVLHESWNKKVFGVIGNLINENNGKTININGVEDHVHCLFGIKPVIAIAELMKIVKAKSLKYIYDHALTTHRFEWQEGYGAFSYGQSQIEDVSKYIQMQKEHHGKQLSRMNTALC